MNYSSGILKNLWLSKQFYRVLDFLNNESHIDCIEESTWKRLLTPSKLHVFFHSQVTPYQQRYLYKEERDLRQTIFLKILTLLPWIADRFPSLHSHFKESFVYSYFFTQIPQYLYSKQSYADFPFRILLNLQPTLLEQPTIGLRGKSNGTLEITFHHQTHLEFLFEAIPLKQWSLFSLSHLKTLISRKKSTNTTRLFLHRRGFFARNLNQLTHRLSDCIDDLEYLDQQRCLCFCLRGILDQPLDEFIIKHQLSSLFLIFKKLSPLFHVETFYALDDSIHQLSFRKDHLLPTIFQFLLDFSVEHGDDTSHDSMISTFHFILQSQKAALYCISSSHPFLRQDHSLLKAGYIYFLSCLEKKELEKTLKSANDFEMQPKLIRL